MAHRKTAQKVRNAARTPLEEQIVLAVGRIAEKPYVAAFEHHFAGYFNELGLFLTFSDSATVANHSELRAQLVAYFSTEPGVVSASWRWLVVATQNNESIFVLAPSDISPA